MGSQWEQVSKGLLSLWCLPPNGIPRGPPHQHFPRSAHNSLHLWCPPPFPKQHTDTHTQRYTEAGAKLYGWHTGGYSRPKLICNPKRSIMLQLLCRKPPLHTMTNTHMYVEQRHLPMADTIHWSNVSVTTSVVTSIWGPAAGTSQYNTEVNTRVC